MASKFWNIYVALKDQTTPDEKEFDEFLNHIRVEINLKYNGYTGVWLSSTNPSLCEDLLQHALGEIWRGIANGSFRPEMNTFKNWTDGLIHNTLRKHFAYQKKQPSVTSLDKLVEDGNQWADDTVPTPESSMLKNDEVSTVRKAMQVLYRKHRKYYQVLYYRTYHELSTAETATLLGTTNEDVSRTLNRAKDKLREIVFEMDGSASKPKLTRK